MGDTVDLTIEILKQIRDEIRQTREELGARIDQSREELGARIDQTNVRLDESNVRLNRVVQEQIRHGTAIIELARVQGATVDALGVLDRRVEGLERGQGQVVDELRKLNTRVDNVLTGPMGGVVRDHEQRITALKRKAG